MSRDETTLSTNFDMNVKVEILAMCGSMVDIQSATAANRRIGEKKRKKKLQLQNIVA